MIETGDRTLQLDWRYIPHLAKITDYYITMRQCKLKQQELSSGWRAARTNVFARGCNTTVRITYPQHLTPSMSGIASSYRVHIWYGKTRIAGLQSGGSWTMIDSAVWAQYINVTDGQTATSHSDRAAKTKELDRTNHHKHRVVSFWRLDHCDKLVNTEGATVKCRAGGGEQLNKSNACTDTSSSCLT